MAPRIVEKPFFSVLTSVHGCVEVPSAQICGRMSELGDYWSRLAFHDRDFLIQFRAQVRFKSGLDPSVRPGLPVEHTF